MSSTIACPACEEGTVRYHVNSWIVYEDVHVQGDTVTCTNDHVTDQEQSYYGCVECGQEWDTDEELVQSIKAKEASQ